MTIDYARRNEMLLLHRDVTATAYERGLEDALYPGIGGIRYRNPFPLGGPDWWDYDNGFADGMKSHQAQRI